MDTRTRAHSGWGREKYCVWLLKFWEFIFFLKSKFFELKSRRKQNRKGAFMFPAERSASYIDLPLPASLLCPTAPCSPLGETHGGLEAACQSRHFKRFLALESERGILSLQHSTGVQCLTLIVSVLKDLVQEKQSSYGKKWKFLECSIFCQRNAKV